MKPNILILLTLLFSILLSAHGWGYEARQRGEKQPRPSIMDQSVDDTAASLIDRHLSRAVILEKEGQIDLAIQELHGLLPFVKEKGTPHQRILALNQLGSLLAVLPFPVDQGSMATNKAVRSMRISPPDTGLNSLTEALALARAEHDGRLSSLVLNNLGTLHGTRRQYSRAASLYQESVQLARQSGGGTLLGASLANMGRLYASTGAAVEAKKSLEEAYRIWNDQPESFERTEALISIGQSFRRLGSGRGGAGYLERSATILREAVNSAVRLNDTRLTSYAMGYLGGLAEESGERDKALSLTRQALFHAQILNSPELLYLWQWQLGRILQGKGETGPALSAYRLSVHSLQSIRRSIRSDSMSAALSFRDMVEPVYLGLTELLLKESDKAADPQTREKYLREVQETIENLRTAELQDYFRDSCIGDQDSHALSSSPPGRTAVVYLISMPARLEILLNLPTGLKHVTSGFASDAVTSEALLFARALSSASSHYEESSVRLYDMIVRPIEGELKREGIEHLVIIPDGILRTIPLAALYDGEKFLVSSYTISSTQGLQLVNLTPSREQKSRQVLMAGISESVGGFPALPSVRSELGGIGTMFSGKTLLDNQFLKDSLKSEIEKTPYSYIHLATHGEFAGDRHNMFILAWDGLITSDNLNRFIRPTKYRSEPVELLTLSACKTAAGDDRAALGLAGIAVKAGAKSTLAALWEIDDKVTAELIQEFYRNLKKAGTTKAAALQQAQLKIMEKQRNPYFWAPFLLIGNWR